MGLRGIELAPLIGYTDGIPVHECLGCKHEMQPDNRKCGIPTLPGVRRHEGRGYCQACRQAKRYASGSVRATRSEAVARAQRLTVDVLLAGLDWNREAACGQAYRPDDFAMPDSYRGGPTEAAVRACATYCARCPVVDDCKAFADAHDNATTPITGLWGGEWRTFSKVEPITTKALVGVVGSTAGTRVTA